MRLQSGLRARERGLQKCLQKNYHIDNQEDFKKSPKESSVDNPSFLRIRY